MSIYIYLEQFVLSSCVSMHACHSVPVYDCIAQASAQFLLKLVLKLKSNSIEIFLQKEISDQNIIFLYHVFVRLDQYM